ncbi:MAG: alpha/beta hydrolase [Candidatus Eremiobacteraeota bacterium]|nr:alpha/beta hydrolase [Candidatus Eremiobacteraeota bacterium]
MRAANAMLATYETGSDAPGAPVVLLLHGLGHWTDAAWGRLVPRIDPALRYVAFDLPGFGASDKPDAAFDLAYFRRVLDDAVAALQLDRFALVGHSLGGFIAADYAGAHPDRVTRLALVAPAAFARTPRHLVYALAGGFARPLFERRPSRRFVTRMLSRAVADPNALDPAVIERAYELSQEPALRRAFAGVYAGAIHAFARARRLHAGFARYPGPVFCAWGAQDRYINVAGLRDVVRVYPRSKTLVLDKSGHLPMIEEPQTLGAALRDFLKN